MLTLRATVFDAPVMGTVTVYSEPTWDGALATADKLLIQATTAQAAGTTRKLTIDLERSNDRESWVVETTLINGQPLSTTTTESWFAQDLGTGTVPGRFRRLALYFTDSGASAHVRVAVAGRARRSKVMRRAASAAAGAAPPAGKAGCSCSGGRCSSGTAATARAGSAPPQLREATFAAPPLRLSAGPAFSGSPRVPAMLPLPHGKGGVWATGHLQSTCLPGEFMLRRTHTFTDEEMACLRAAIEYANSAVDNSSLVREYPSVCAYAMAEGPNEDSQAMADAYMSFRKTIWLFAFYSQLGSGACRSIPRAVLDQAIAATKSPSAGPVGAYCGMWDEYIYADYSELGQLPNAIPPTIPYQECWPFLQFPQPYPHRSPFPPREWVF